MNIQEAFVIIAPMKKAKGKIIVIEGPDATGKSTLVRRLVDTLDAVSYPCPKGDHETTKILYDLMKRYPDNEAGSKKVLALTTHAFNIDRMEKLREEGNTVICDRSILSLVAYQRMTYNEVKAVFDVVNVPLDFYDLAIVLSADEQTIVDRLKTRGMDILDRYFYDNRKEIIDRYREYSSDVYPCYMKINTSLLNEHEVYDEAMKAIYSLNET